MKKTYAVLFLTPAILLRLYARYRMGEKSLMDGVSIGCMFEALEDFIKAVETDEAPLPCALCAAELRRLEDIGSIIALYDPGLADEDQDTIWCAACNDCHEEDPATAQTRMLRHYADYADGEIMLMHKDHPTPQ